MLDDLHDDLLVNLGSLLEGNRVSKDSVVEGTIESLFLVALRYCHERKEQMTEQDWIRVGGWLNECGSYFKDYDFVLRGIVISKGPDASGRRDVDLSEIVDRARLAWEFRES